MPLSFPSHLAPVLPLKLWRPRWFDGVALATGTVAPDVAYLTTGTGVQVTGTHTVAGLLWWCLPVALGYAWLVRHCAATVAPYLPAGYRWAAELRVRRHRWWITVGSALLGAVSHLGWDWLTHTDGWLHALGVDWYAVTGLHWWTVSDLSSSLLGAVAVVILARRFARRPANVDRPGRRDTHGATSARPVVFRRVAATVAVVGVALLPLLPAAREPAPTGVRLLHLVALAALLGALAANRAASERTGRLEPEQR
ncbi:DUF4184 family protein [Micromonospora avicenniae]|uniref:DUF4184 family protein n=1 Tax=Micromonospora avicenniae TaxID=1198245 RepID=UPI0033343BE9